MCPSLPKQAIMIAQQAFVGCGPGGSFKFPMREETFKFEKQCHPAKLCQPEWDVGCTLVTV
eukprot:1363038-Rhodomonas_salina.1